MRLRGDVNCAAWTLVHVENIKLNSRMDGRESFMRSVWLFSIGKKRVNKKITQKW